MTTVVITHRKIESGGYVYSDRLAGNGPIAAKYGVYVDGKLTYIIVQKTRGSWNRPTLWDAITLDYRPSRIPGQSTLKAMQERVEQRVNGVS